MSPRHASPDFPVGTRFGMLTIAARPVKTPKGRFYPCVCECGKVTIPLHGSLKRGATRSCGCLRSRVSGAATRERWAATRRERFMTRFRVDEATGCWLWLGALDPDGYGHFKMDAGPWPAHRVAWELLRGPIPEGFHIDHTCHSSRADECRGVCIHRSCVNPDHLEPVLPAENTRRAMRSRCKHGHEFTPDNTYIRQGGGRTCRRCMVIAQMRYQARRRR